jgi:glycosyl transferase, family 25
MRHGFGPAAPTGTRWPIFVISLVEASARRSAIVSQFKQIGLQFEFVDAIDGRGGLPEKWNNMIDRQKSIDLHGFPMKDTEFACALSHQLVYRRIVDDSLPGAIVLEDDAILTPNFAEFYHDAAYRHAPFIQLFCFSARIWRGPGRRILPGVRMHRLAENPFMTVGYSISRAAAEGVIRTSLPLCQRADWPTDMTQFGGQMTIPWIIRHPPPGAGDSYIHDGTPPVLVEGFDANAKYSGYAKGWRRLLSMASWGRLIRRKLTRTVNLGF